jgi:pyruvate dehydrogenase E1 component alpha subunit
VEQGIFHESLNFAALKRLPVLFVCENNFYATQSPITNRQPLDNIFKHGEVYGIPGERVDGNDVLAVYSATDKAVQRCRRGEGPTLLECRTYRWREHVGPSYDYDMGYRTKEEVEQWMARCPLESWKEQLLQANVVTEADLQLVSSKIAKEIESAFTLVKADPVPEDTELLENVY